jgi:hypothetical protein
VTATDRDFFRGRGRRDRDAVASAKTAQRVVARGRRPTRADVSSGVAHHTSRGELLVSGELLETRRSQTRFGSPRKPRSIATRV